MKVIGYILVLLSAFSCRFAEVEVDSDYSYAGKFHRYKTFSFVDNQTFKGLERDESLIEHNITRVLESWGYRYKESRADFMISYHFFFEDVKIVGYRQPQFHFWVKSRFGNEFVAASADSLAVNDPLLPGEDVKRRHEKYNSASMELNEGTIFVTFLDRKKDQSVWQGYASGVFGGDVQNNERKVRAAVIRILDQFRLVSPPS